jgi:hypothetical protein
MNSKFSRQQIAVAALILLGGTLATALYFGSRDNLDDSETLVDSADLQNSAPTSFTHSDLTNMENRVEQLIDGYQKESAVYQAIEIGALVQAVGQLQAQLAAQADEISTLKGQYSDEARIRREQINHQANLIKSQTQQIDRQMAALQELKNNIAGIQSGEIPLTGVVAQTVGGELSDDADKVVGQQSADATMYDVSTFPGSIPIQGTSAALRVGGFVKMNIVENFQAIGSQDRFIVGTIPVPEVNVPAEASLTVSQSRLNFDLRDVGTGLPLRAFVEGDFAGVDNNGSDTFRLRHAFGQYKVILAGKTWSAFMDSQAMPEDLDFEGINGQILLRQPQIRISPKIGENWDLMFSLEDPNPQITGGKGISQVPDFVASARRTWFKRWHVKTAVLYRNISGICDCLDNPDGSVTGWGVTVSAKTGIRLWDERDNLQVQFNVGTGLGRYVNDLGSIGGQDAVFDQTTGELVALPVASMYVSLQKWFANNMRMNFNYSYVQINNVDFQPDDAYYRTQRFGGSFIWSPIDRIDIGAELLWGQRMNKDREFANASQLQLSATYRY